MSSPLDPKDLFERLYSELRKLAHAKMYSENPGKTLQPTALLHEAWIRLFQYGSPTINDEKHFVSLVALKMRQILIDQSRIQKGRATLCSLCHDIKDSDSELLSKLEICEELSKLDADQSTILTLRIQGFTNKEIESLLEMAESTLELKLRLARAFLLSRLKESQS